MSRNLILNNAQIQQKITRIAAEISEKNFLENEIILAGIIGNGFLLSKLIGDELVKLGCKSKVIEIKIDKKKPEISKIDLSENIDIENKSVVLVDDVLNSGKTFSFAMAALIAKRVNKIQSAVLINRSYKSFPVHADFVGLSLSTTLEEHVSVEISAHSMEAYLH
jgi:pyrimidine operon attenuation protein/uracil phosphoribosyltransferase